MPQPALAPQLQSATERLFSSWLRDCQQQVADYLTQDGSCATPGRVAGACPACFGSPAVAAWAMEQSGHGLPEELLHERGTAVLRRQPLPVPA